MYQALSFTFPVFSFSPHYSLNLVIILLLS